MFVYLFPIFAFGLLITGIVILGLKQASDLAKDLAAPSSKVESISKNHEVASPGSNPAPLNSAARVSQQ